MAFSVINEAPSRDKPYGVTRYRVDNEIEFTLTDILERKEELIKHHGEGLRDLLEYIENQLVD